MADAGETASQLKSLAVGYAWLRERLAAGTARVRVSELLGLTATSEWMLDDRIVGRIELLEQDAPVPAHEYARLVLRSLIDAPGPLLDHSWVAAYLGVRPSKSPDWQRLLEGPLAELEYRGLFCDAWRRWWEPGLAAWWRELIGKDQQQPLLLCPRLSESRRFAGATGLADLKPAAPIEPGYGDCYSTVCAFLREPSIPWTAFAFS